MSCWASFWTACQFVWNWKPSKNCLIRIFWSAFWRCCPYVTRLEWQFQKVDYEFQKCVEDDYVILLDGWMCQKGLSKVVSLEFSRQKRRMIWKYKHCFFKSYVVLLGAIFTHSDVVSKVKCMWQLMQTFHPLWTRFAGLSHERAAKMKTDNGNDVLGKWKSHPQSFNKISSYFLSVYTKFYISLQGIKTLLSTFSFFVYFVLLENVRRRIRWFFHFPKNVSLSWRICLLSRPLLELRPHHQTLTCQKK